MGLHFQLLLGSFRAWYALFDWLVQKKYKWLI